jgi:hypothetical protein
MLSRFRIQARRLNPTSKILLSYRWHGNVSDNEKICDINITFKKKDGSVVATKGFEGQSLLRLAQKYEVELEGEVC